MTWCDHQQKYLQDAVVAQRREFAALCSWVRETFTDVEIIELVLEGKLGAQHGQLGRWDGGCNICIEGFKCAKKHIMEVSWVAAPTLIWQK